MAIVGKSYHGEEYIIRVQYIRAILEMGYPVIFLRGLSLLGGIAKSQKKAKNLLKAYLNKLVNLPYANLKWK